MRVKICLVMAIFGLILAQGVNSSLFSKSTSSEEQVQIDQCIPGSPGMFKFLGKNVVRVYEGQSATFQNFCFQQNEVSYVFKSALEIEVTLHSSNAKTLTCSDTFICSYINQPIDESEFYLHAYLNFELQDRDQQINNKFGPFDLVSDQNRIETKFLRGTSKYTLNLDNQDTADYIKANGLRLLRQVINPFVGVVAAWNCV